ncbi:MAG: endonuclease [bacterium (Candidatus Ratteibacteria) CG_4_9_14_3_um_filter_41_21]|uniref:Endonuclease n=3 Tax=Candidatus Ratteibacteria TaxID=2979319 RepID=A0A2M7EA84_9BACT|nr:MAG: endonuclease [bacterium (Candidatus Ratteibacteria) CG01_land_8_20_14_3_00_40_19]PIW33811.1 MAG: endonuclease [bacterium (Candidatus Ratteibacteria) CG15_BIG_FIL_POST_REV_8_21_14_020_41_12]PJA61458.1 MAG: endonuclease [bacterium (Candidatus Ratteibacteria) CG_4_9_14_3_um_filter_41_21]
MEYPLITLYESLYKSFGPQHWWPARTKFEIIAGAILTQQTTWKNVEKAIENLRKEHLLSVKNLGEAPLRKIEKLVRPVGYYRQKSKHLKGVSAYLLKHCRGDLNKFFRKETKTLRKELLMLRGIGKETADSILLYAGEKRVFVIDAYTRRVLQRLNLLVENDYDKIRRFFEKNLPKNIKIYREFHALLVKLGKEFCKRKPLCQSCPVLKEGLCPGKL